MSNSTSKPSSTQTSTDYSNAFNKTITASLASGATGFTSGDITSSKLNYALNSNNTSTTENLGANSSSQGGTGDTPDTSSDLSSIIPYLLIGVALIVVVMIFKK